MSAEILEANLDMGLWQKRLSSLPAEMQDVYFLPQYLALHCSKPNSRGLCFVFSNKNRTWLYPFILRTFLEVAGVSFTTPFQDIETAYGYGGPLANCREPVFLAEAHASFKDWCRATNIIAEFIRLHPLLGNQEFLDPEVEVFLDRETRSLSLVDLNAEDPPFNSASRYMLRRAERSGVEVKAVSPRASVDRFVELYLSTMDRVSADPYYYFDDQYFAHLCSLVTESGFMLAAVLEGRWVGSSIFLHGTQDLHYHLSASSPLQRVPGLTNLILWAAALIGQKAGLRRLHLGGGLTGNPKDSLLRFKTMMSNFSHEFFIGKRILNPELYQQVRDAWSIRYPSLVPRYGHQVLCYHNKL